MGHSLAFRLPASGFRTASQIKCGDPIPTIARNRGCIFPGCRGPDAGRRLFFLADVFRDVHDLVLEDEQVGSALAGQPNHIPVVILDPAADRLAIQQFHGNRLLLFSQRFKESSFLIGVFRRRRAAPLGGIGIPLGAERHSWIVHKAREVIGETTDSIYPQLKQIGKRTGGQLKPAKP